MHNWREKKERKPEAWTSLTYTVRGQHQSFRPHGSQKGGNRSIGKAHPFSLPEYLKKKIGGSKQTKNSWAIGRTALPIPTSGSAEGGCWRS